MQKIEWDEELAEVAQAHANLCEFKHDQDNCRYTGKIFCDIFSKIEIFLLKCELSHVHEHLFVQMFFLSHNSSESQQCWSEFNG